MTIVLPFEENCFASACAHMYFPFGVLQARMGERLDAWLCVHYLNGQFDPNARELYCPAYHDEWQRSDRVFCPQYLNIEKRLYPLLHTDALMLIQKQLEHGTYVQLTPRTDEEALLLYGFDEEAEVFLAAAPGRGRLSLPFERIETSVDDGRPFALWFQTCAPERDMETIDLPRVKREIDAYRCAKSGRPIFEGGKRFGVEAVRALSERIRAAEEATPALDRAWRTLCEQKRLWHRRRRALADVIDLPETIGEACERLCRTADALEKIWRERPPAWRADISSLTEQLLAEEETILSYLAAL